MVALRSRPAHRKMKLGTSVQVLPGRNPVLLAKPWASLDRLSGGRALPAFGLGVVEPHRATGVRRGARRTRRSVRRGAAARCAVSGPRRPSTTTVSTSTTRASPSGPPGQQPHRRLARRSRPGELRRVGRLSDGWLPSFCTPEQVADGRVIVEEAAADAGRAIDPEHFGALVAYARTAIPRVRGDRGGRHGIDPAEVVPWASTRCGRGSRSSSRSGSRSCGGAGRAGQVVDRSSTTSPTRCSTSSDHAG